METLRLEGGGGDMRARGSDHGPFSSEHRQQLGPEQGRETRQCCRVFEHSKVVQTTCPVCEGQAVLLVVCIKRDGEMKGRSSLTGFPHATLAENDDPVHSVPGLKPGVGAVVELRSLGRRHR